MHYKIVCYVPLSRNIFSSLLFLFFLDNWQEGWTPLHCASQAGHLDVVKLLTESGAATTAETTNGQSSTLF